LLTAHFQEEKAMSKQLLERIPFAKIIVAQAILFAIALGLCRLDAHLTEHGQKITGTMDGFIFLTSLMQLGVITLTGVGIIVTLVLWLVAALAREFGKGNANRQE
jgi:formate-dependent nitrite reductase membrane component NrfD